MSKKRAIAAALLLGVLALGAESCTGIGSEGPMAVEQPPEPPLSPPGDPPNPPLPPPLMQICPDGSVIPPDNACPDRGPPRDGGPHTVGPSPIRSLAAAQYARADGLNASELIDCPAMGEVASPADCTAYTNAPLGVAVLGTEPAMKITKPQQFYDVKLIVGRRERQASIEASVAALGQTSSDEIRLGPWICAELHAVKFEIRGDPRQCKRRGMSAQVSFTWQVSPLSKGLHLVSATVQSLTEKDGLPLDQIDSNQVDIEVTADAVTWFEGLIDDVKRIVDKLTELAGGLGNLLAAIAATSAAISLIIWRWKRLGQNPEAKPQAPSGGGETAP